MRSLQTIAPVDSHLPDTKTPRAGGALHPIGGDAVAARAGVDVLAARARRCRVLLAPRARARIDVVMRAQFVECRGVEGAALRLTHDRPVPLEAVALERGQDIALRAGVAARTVDILDAHDPFAARRACIAIARDGRDQGAEVKRAGRRGSETTAVDRRAGCG